MLSKQVLAKGFSLWEEGESLRSKAFPFILWHQTLPMYLKIVLSF